MLKNKLVALSLAGVATSFASPAFAQGIPVIDTSSIIQQIEQVRQGVQMIQTANDQLNQAKDLYRDLNKATDIGNLANSLKNDVLRGTDVSEANIAGFTSGDLDVVGGLRGKAQEAYQGIMNQLPANASAETRAAYEQGAREAAVTAGLASNVGTSVTGRREGLEELRSRLNSSTSAAERADMSARLQLEQAQMTNDMMALQAIEIQRRAKEEASRQAYFGQEAAQRAKRDQQMGID